MSALSILRTYVVRDGEPLKKSFYMFDLEVFEGKQSLLHALQLLDIEIVKQAFEHIFPNYDTTNLDLKRARAEIRGFLINSLRKDLEETTEQPSV